MGAECAQLQAAASLFFHLPAAWAYLKPPSPPFVPWTFQMLLPDSNRTGVTRVLLVDDDPAQLRGFAVALGGRGFEVTTCLNGTTALASVRTALVDVIVTDITLPDLDGLQLIRELRRIDLDVPIILITGQPAVETAVKAVEYGAHRYLSKPVPVDRLVETIERAAHVGQIARNRRAAAKEFGDAERLAGDRAGVEANFAQALSSLWVAYQPIITTQGALFGFEAFLRTDDRLFPSPPAMFAAAESLHRLAELSLAVRNRAVDALSSAPEGSSLFLNVHPADLLDPSLREPSGAFAAYAERIVLEITERARLIEVPDSNAVIASLRKRGFRIAVDDLGSGYAGLNSFASLEPDIVKLDMMLVRGVETSRTRQRLIQSVCRLCKDMNIQVVAEGVETSEEESTLISLGCGLLQGFRYARPARAFPTHSNAPPPTGA
jgi:EAL domain-containing protein (putative c-di-GMP-specific phosphodiesterase class I)